MQSKEKKFKIENNILKGTENPSRKLKYTSLSEAILHNFNEYPDSVGQIDCVTGEEYKYEKMRDRSVRCAIWMKKQGLLAGDIVLICSHDHMDFAMPCFGALFLGAIVNPFDVGLHPNEFRHMMNIIKPKIAFVNEDTATIIAQAAEDIKLDLKIVVFGRPPDFINYESIIAEATLNEVNNFEHTPVQNVDQTAVILSTSGSTSSPKGVELSHSVFLKQFAEDTRRWIQRNAIFFVSLISYTGAFQMIMTACTNETRFVTSSFDEYMACEFIERYKIACSYITANRLNRLLKSGALKKYDISSLKEVLCGGSSLAVESQKAFAESVPNAVLYTCYGLTECGLIAHEMLGKKLESVGHIWDMVDVKVINSTTGQVVGTNQQGELLLKTNVMMNGYYNNPQATAEAIDKEGWLHSGDIGYYDEDGNIYVLDRFKELILYRNNHISPVEIEKILIAHPGVKEVIVVGMPHSVDGQHPIAFVIKTDSSVYKKELTEEELIDFVAAQVVDTKRLRGGVKFVENLPKTQSGKIRRRNVRALAISLAAT